MTQVRHDRLSPELAKALQSGLIAAGAPPRVSQEGAPAKALEWCTTELQKLISVRQSREAHRWKVRLRSVRGAFAWVRNEAPPSWAVKCPDSGREEASRAGAAKLLEKWWRKLLCKEGCPTERTRFEAFAAEYPEAQPGGKTREEGPRGPEQAPTTGNEVRRCIKKMRQG